MATYGRSLYGIALGLFTARWAMGALGHTDYGLYGVVGGLTSFVVFFNGLLSGAVSRFYAFSVGEASVAANHDEGIEECRRWFSIAVGLHTILSIVLIAIGYPVGVWAVRDFLSIPPDRIESCIWVWRCTCISCFIGMVNVPFQAMYTAKQAIAELTIYAFVTATLNAIFLYYIVSHPGDWLATYATWIAAMVVLPQLCICVRAAVCFPECKFKLSYAFDKGRILRLLSFAGMNFVGALSQVCSTQGMNIIVNKFLGPTKNAAMAIANTVNGQAATLSAALFGAFQPAITNAAGAGDMVRMRNLVFRTCTLGTLGVLIFAIPLFLEADEVLLLWLGNPPESAALLVMYLMIVRVIDRISDGHWVAILAMGDIVAFRTVESLTFWSMLVLAPVLIYCGFGIASIGMTMAVCRFGSALVKLYYGKTKAGLSVLRWFREVFIPIVLVMLCSLLTGALPRVLMVPSFLRIVLTTVACEMALLPLSWFLLLKQTDRVMILKKLHLGR